MDSPIPLVPPTGLLAEPDGHILGGSTEYADYAGAVVLDRGVAFFYDVDGDHGVDVVMLMDGMRRRNEGGVRLFLASRQSIPFTKKARVNIRSGHTYCEMQIISIL